MTKRRLFEVYLAELTTAARRAQQRQSDSPRTNPLRRDRTPTVGGETATELSRCKRCCNHSSPASRSGAASADGPKVAGKSSGAGASGSETLGAALDPASNACTAACSVELNSCLILFCSDLEGIAYAECLFDCYAEDTLCRTKCFFNTGVYNDPCDANPELEQCGSLIDRHA